MMPSGSKLINVNTRLTYLAEILVAISGSPVPSQQFQALADYAGFVLSHDYLAICLVSPDQKGYWVHSLSGAVAGAIPTRLFHLEEGIVGQVLQTNRAFTTTHLADLSAPTIAELESVCLEFGLEAVLALPIRQGKRPIGAMLFMAKFPTTYEDDDIQIGKLIAAGLSAALDNTRLYQVLADERSTLASVLNSTQDAVLVVNEQGVVLLANPAVERMLALDAAALPGSPLSDVIKDGPLAQLFHHPPEGVPQEGITEMVLPGGGTAQVSLAQVTSDYGEAIGWAAVFRDISLLKELEQMKSEFVNTVSHDLKNPISAIQLAANLLDRSGTLNEPQQSLRDRILTTTNYMQELVSDLLDLGKIEAGLDHVVKPFDLVQLIETILDDLRPSAEEKSQTLAITLPPEMKTAGDQRRLHQVLLNLIGNAIKYTPAGGQIKVEATRKQDNFVVMITDNGIGIPANDLPYIFDKFYRVANDETRHIKGTGLGLAIVKSIIEAHNGRVWVESIPGEGSTFAFSLPVTPALP